MKYNIAVGGIHIESSTFSTYISSFKDFNIIKNNDLLNAYPWFNDYKKLNFIPLTHARALPGGKVSFEFFSSWFNEFQKLLTNAKAFLDGVFLDLHGAMFVEGMVDAEGYLVNEIRKIVGPKVLISITSDLHGNISNKLFDSTDLITCYKTAPHIDVLETKKRALNNLIYLLENSKDDLVKVKIDIPILLPGEKTSTFVEPGKSLYERLLVIEENKEILDASIWMGFPWADEKRSKACLIITSLNEDLALKEANKLALYFWNIRDEFKFVGPALSVNNALKEALNSEKKPFFISDTGDNPGAGGLGDLTIILEKLVKLNEKSKITKKVLFASIFDLETINNLSNSNTQIVTINLGNKTDKSYGNPLTLDVEIIYKTILNRAGKVFLVKYENIYLLITENRFQYGRLEYFINSGIKDLNDFDIVVVKMGYLEPDLDKLQKGFVLALSDGVVNQDLVSLKYQNLDRPMVPFDGTNFKLILNTSVIKG